MNKVKNVARIWPPCAMFKCLSEYPSACLFVSLSVYLRRLDQALKIYYQLPNVGAMINVLLRRNVCLPVYLLKTSQWSTEAPQRLSYSHQELRVHQVLGGVQM